MSFDSFLDYLMTLLSAEAEISALVSTEMKSGICRKMHFFIFQNKIKHSTGTSDKAFEKSR
jgi:hypothetical protein